MSTFEPVRCVYLCVPYVVLWTRVLIWYFNHLIHFIVKVFLLLGWHRCSLSWERPVNKLFGISGEIDNDLGSQVCCAMSNRLTHIFASMILLDAKLVSAFAFCSVPWTGTGLSSYRQYTIKYKSKIWTWSCVRETFCRYCQINIVWTISSTQEQSKSNSN